MKLKFWDINVWVGKNPINGSVSEVDDLLIKMKKLKIKKAIVWHILLRYAHPLQYNLFLLNSIRDKEVLYGIMPLLPPSTEEADKMDFSTYKKNKIVGFTFLPKTHRYLFHKVALENILFELEARQFPVFFDIMHEFFPGSPEMRDLYNILAEFPKLTCILFNLGVWNVNRYIWPLLEKYENVYLESSFLSLWEGGLEETVKKFGAGKVIFGTGYPERYMESSILSLMHSEISEEDKEKIAYKNIEGLIGRIKYE